MQRVVARGGVTQGVRREHPPPFPSLAHMYTTLQCCAHSKSDTTIYSLFSFLYTVSIKRWEKI